jgi:hypothetical protein
LDLHRITFGQQAQSLLFSSRAVEIPFGGSVLFGRFGFMALASTMRRTDALRGDGPQFVVKLIRTEDPVTADGLVISWNSAELTILTISA